METKTETARSLALTLGLSNTKNRLDTLLHTAEQKDMTHLCFPYEKRLESFDISFCPSLTAKKLRQLGELKWVEQIYNLTLLEPLGLGKIP